MLGVSESHLYRLIAFRKSILFNILQKKIDRLFILHGSTFIRPNCHVECLFKLIDKMADLLLKSAKIIWVDLAEKGFLIAWGIFVCKLS